MYNYLVAYNIETWESRAHRYPRQRFCQDEYTNEILRARFSTLTTAAISEICALPCIFAAEGNEHDVRIGYVHRIEERDGTIFFDFDFDRQIPPIPFADFDALRYKLDIKDRYELRTTHWAIKSSDLLAILSEAGLMPTAARPLSGSGKPLTSNTNTSLKRLNRDVSSKPTMFIGSSVEGKSLAEAIQENLDYEVAITIWHQGVFGLSGGTLETLVTSLDQYDFATLVLTADDLVEKRGVLGQSPRDNVLLELGLFIGALGRERTFIVHSRTNPPVLPTDLAGITPATYEDRPNLLAALGPACSSIKRAIAQCGIR